MTTREAEKIEAAIAAIETGRTEHGVALLRDVLRDDRRQVPPPIGVRWAEPLTPSPKG